MNANQKVAIFSACLMAPLLVATGIWVVPAVTQAYHDSAYLKGFQTIHDAKTPLTVAQVETAMGKPARIEQSESADQTIKGTVYHYPANGQDMKVTFVNGVVFRTQSDPEAKL